MVFNRSLERIVRSKKKIFGGKREIESLKAREKEDTTMLVP